MAVNPPQLVARAVAPGLAEIGGGLAAEARNRRLEIQRLRHFRNIMPARVPAILKPQPGRAAGDRLLCQLGQLAPMPASPRSSALCRGWTG